MIPIKDTKILCSESGDPKSHPNKTYHDQSVYQVYWN